MKNYCEFFKGKKVTIMGLGLLGRGVGDAEFLAKCGAEVLVTDLKSEGELTESLSRLGGYENISFTLGEHRLEDFENKDFILKAAGVPIDSPYITHARESGIPVAMSTALFAGFAQQSGATIVGVTGTRGKTTVAHMIHSTLTSLSNPVTKSVHLGGNIRGVSTMVLLPEVKARDICVLELDSWQLQGFGYEAMSPHIAVFTNFYPDHLNYYKDLDEYFADKANIFKFQDEKSGDTLIIGEQIAASVREANPPVEPIISVPLPEHWALKVPGMHNRENAALAREALSALGVPDEEMQAGLENFPGVEGRLEYMGETDKGVKIYNDNNATTPEATLAALHTLGENIVLIAGGTDKGTDLAKVAEEINKRCKKVFLLNESGAKRLAPLLKNLEMHDTFADTVNSAFISATPGDTILFSPLFSSFGKEFKNEYDRNDQFKALVAKYLKQT